MTKPLLRRALLALLACAAASAPLAPARAEPPALRFRGTVESRNGDALTIRRPGGSTVTMMLEPRSRIYTANAARLRDIKPESYIGVVSGSGTERTERVTLFSPSERGFEAGHQPWDTAPGATLTAGRIAGLDGTDPLRVTLDHDGQRSAFAIPADTPVTQVSPGEKALLVPGAAVTAFTRSAADGALTADSVIVGRQGAVPTL